VTARSDRRRVGLIGYPLGHSISPAFQQPAFDALGLAVDYELWETQPDRLGDRAAALRGDAYLGANVTIPHKQQILQFVDRVDVAALTVGAVNTIVSRDGELSGSNTDVLGFADALRIDGKFEARGRNAVVLGAGGAARAVVASLVASGAARVTICARRAEQAEALIEALAAHRRPSTTTTFTAALLDSTSADLIAAVSAGDLLVNATPIGTAHRADSDSSPIEPEVLHDRLLVCDLVYNPPVTPLLRAARYRGARVLSGLPMLVYQGAAAFRLWTGEEPPIELMRAKAMEALGV